MSSGSIFGGESIISVVSVSFFDLFFSLSLVLLMWKYFCLVVVSVVSNSFKSKYLTLILLVSLKKRVF